eukprot:PhM_4_TR10602/c0_g1_i3/m.32663
MSVKISFRLLVLVISTTILVITAALCLTLTWRQSNSIVSSTREKSDASFNVLYDAALSTASDVNERWVLSTAASILTDLSSSTEVIPRTLKVTRRVIERYNTDDSLLSLLPTLSALLSSSDLSQIYYMERSPVFVNSFLPTCFELQQQQTTAAPNDPPRPTVAAACNNRQEPPRSADVAVPNGGRLTYDDNVVFTACCCRATHAQPTEPTAPATSGALPTKTALKEHNSHGRRLSEQCVDFAHITTERV